MCHVNELKMVLSRMDIDIWEVLFNYFWFSCEFCSCERAQDGFVTNGYRYMGGLF
jgi:hypothetical protein